MSLSSRLRWHFDSANARFVELPVLHPAEPFLETAGEDVRRRMFVTEGPQGERLALRPDFTIPVCLLHLESHAGPTRYAYEGLTFRRHDLGSPERLETGYEDFGAAERVGADAAALSLALACAAECTTAGLSVRLGDIGLFDALLSALGLPGRWRRRLRRSFGIPRLMESNLKRMTVPRHVEDEQLDPKLRAVADDQTALVALLAERRLTQGYSDTGGRSPEDIVARFFDGRAIHDVAVAQRASHVLTEYLQLTAGLGDAIASLEAFAARHAIDIDSALDVFERRAAAIARLAPGASIRFEAGFGRPLDYYTGLVFEVLAGGMAAPLVGGGRYDRMMEMLGAPDRVPAVGFTMRLDLVDGGQP